MLESPDSTELENGFNGSEDATAGGPPAANLQCMPTTRN